MSRSVYTGVIIIDPKLTADGFMLQVCRKRCELFFYLCFKLRNSCFQIRASY